MAATAAVRVRTALERLKPKASLAPDVMDTWCRKLTALIESLDPAPDPLLAALDDLNSRIASCGPDQPGKAALEAARDLLSGHPATREAGRRLIRAGPLSVRRLQHKIERLLAFHENVDEDDPGALAKRAQRSRKKALNGGRQLQVDVRTLAYQAGTAFHHVTGRPAGKSAAFPRLLRDLFAIAGISASAEHYARAQRDLRTRILANLKQSEGE